MWSQDTIPLGFLGLTCVRHLIGEDQLPVCGLRASHPYVCTISTQLKQGTGQVRCRHTEISDLGPILLSLYNVQRKWSA